MYCKLWLNASENTTSIIRTPANVLIKTLLKYTFSLLSESQRLRIIQELAENDPSQLILLGFDGITNGELSKSQQFGKQTITKMKETFAKLNPNTEIVSSRECMELVKIFK